MSIIRKVLKEDAVYWAKTGVDRASRPVYASPVAIRCRWDDVQEEYTDLQGNVRKSNASVMVDRVVTLKGVLWYGLLASLSGDQLTQPLSNEGAFPIQRVQRIPNFKATEYLRIAIL